MNSTMWISLWSTSPISAPRQSHSVRPPASLSLFWTHSDPRHPFTAYDSAHNQFPSPHPTSPISHPTCDWASREGKVFRVSSRWNLPPLALWLQERHHLAEPRLWNGTMLNRQDCCVDWEFNWRPGLIWANGLSSTHQLFSPSLPLDSRGLDVFALVSVSVFSYLLQWSLLTGTGVLPGLNMPSPSLLFS